MTTTTPDEFLQFAREMGLEQIKSTSLPNNNNNNNGYTLTGLSVLNNLCHLIEQIHTLKIENDRLRAHLELANHVNKILSKSDEKKSLHVYDGEKSLTPSPSNSLKIKKYSSTTVSTSSKERLGVDIINNPDDSSSMIHTESDMMDSNLGLSTAPAWNNWIKVRHALKFSLRRKPDPPITSPQLTIPAISISVESGEDDHHLQDNKREKKKKKILTTNDNRKDLIGEDTDHDDESIECNRSDQKRKLYRDDKRNSSSNERQDINFPIVSMPTDDENLLRKQSKIAHYRRKLRSKLNTVKRQFSEQSPSSSLRLFSNPYGSTVDDFGPGLNHALLTAQLAPAMTKSYQEKMRAWQTMQKSNFLVDYRRQSITNKIEFNNESRKISVISTINETSDEPQTLSADEAIHEIKPNILTLSPTLSPNQRSLIVRQWREIMSEEISLRHYNEYFQRKIQELKKLETDLKFLKTSIFCTNNQEYFLKHRCSMTSIEQLDQDLLDQHRQTFLPQRSRSLQSLESMPASWILAVQSAAYSDILDGTSNKTTDRAIIFNRNFFNQLHHFKNDRLNFEQDTFKNLPILTNSKINISYENLNDKRLIRTRPRIILTRAYLRKLSLISPTEIPPMHPMIPLQTKISKFETSSHIDLLTISETESNLPSSSTTLNKRLKRSRFDLKKTLQRSKSMCMTQFHSWLQRRRQQYHLSVPRRKSAVDSKPNKELRSSPCSTPKLLGSPRLARLHQRIFKHHPSPTSPLPPTEFPFLPPPPPPSQPPPPQTLDDSDQYFRKQESPVRIYLPACTSPTTRHVRIINNEIKTPPMSKIPSPIITRRNFSSSIKMTTAKERRESYAALTNILNNQ